MTEAKYDSIGVADGIVYLQLGCVDSELMFPISRLLAIEVNWERESGAIKLYIDKVGSTWWVSEEKDGGAACSETIDMLMTAWRGGDDK